MTGLDFRAGQGFSQRHKELLALLLLNLVLKGFLLSETDVVSNDGPTYLNISKHFLDGNLACREAFRGDYHFYAALVALFSMLVPGNAVDSLINAGQILSTIFSVLAVVPFYLLVEKVWSARAAFWGALAFCVAPGINKYAVDVMRDPGYLLCFLTALYFGWLFMERPRVVPLLGAVITSGFAFLFRIEGLLLMPLLFFWAVFLAFREGRDGRWLVRGLLVILIMGGVGGALAWYLQSDAGTLSRYGGIATGTGKVATGEFYNYNPELKKILDDAGRQLPGTANDNDFFSIVKNHIRTIYFLGLVVLVAEVTWPPFFLLAVIGIAMAWRRGCVSWYFLSIVMAYLALGFFYNMQRNYLEERYVYSVVVLLLAYAGYGLALLLEKVSDHRYGGVALAMIFLLGAVPASLQSVKNRRKWQSHPFKEAGLWLAAQPDIQEARLMANERKIPFYAGKFNGYSALPTHLEGPPIQEHFFADIDYIAIESGTEIDDKYMDIEGFKLVKKAVSDRYSAVIYKRTAYK